MESPLKIQDIRFDPESGLVPAIIQDATSGAVLMLGYMNHEAVSQTLQTGKVVFWSRSKQRLWMKGETSGNYLTFLSFHVDCDADALLVRAQPNGPTCHTGTQSCFGSIPPSAIDRSLYQPSASIGFLLELEKLLRERRASLPHGSYTAELFRSGRKRIAQKVGEEGVEMALAAALNERAAMISEGADLIFHLLALLVDADIPLQELVQELLSRHCKSHQTHQSDQAAIPHVSSVMVKE